MYQGSKLYRNLRLGSKSCIVLYYSIVILQKIKNKKLKKELIDFLKFIPKNFSVFFSAKCN